jgi:uncharacterized Zn finger protein (UPF0148 family)
MTCRNCGDVHVKRETGQVLSISIGEEKSISVGEEKNSRTEHEERWGKQEQETKEDRWNGDKERIGSSELKRLGFVCPTSHAVYTVIPYTSFRQRDKTWRLVCPTKKCRCISEHYTDSRHGRVILDSLWLDPIYHSKLYTVFDRRNVSDLSVLPPHGKRRKVEVTTQVQVQAGIKTVSLLELLKKDLSPETILRNCHCGQNTSTRTSYFDSRTLPNILMFHASRFEHKPRGIIRKVSTPIHANIELNITNLVGDIDLLGQEEEEEEEEEEYRYRLRSIVCHEGATPQNGHYYTYVKHDSGPGWTKYDDHCKTVYENANPLNGYIFVYQKL